MTIKSLNVSDFNLNTDLHRTLHLLNLIHDALSLCLLLILLTRLLIALLLGQLIWLLLNDGRRPSRMLGCQDSCFEGCAQSGFEFVK